MTPSNRRKLGIVVGGGPAPGINGVIRAVTNEALRSGIETIGILDGFKWLAAGDASHIRVLDAEAVERIHLQGGSILRTARENPSKNEEKLKNVVSAIKALQLNYLVTIGGDDTAFTSSKVAQVMGTDLEVVHVPKTIDNDLPLPHDIPTFGYQTARQVGTELVSTLLEDARTTGRWYFVVAMGRTAGHLALGIGKAAGAAITLIPEEFRGKSISLDGFCRILEGSIIKRKAAGYANGVAIIAEGAAESIDPQDFNQLSNVERDEHGHVRLAELPFGAIVKDRVRTQLAELGLKTTIVDKNIGYELRCTTPVASDLEYTQDLGRSAVQLLLQGGHGGSMVCLHGAEVKPLKLSEMLDPKTGKTRVRRVDVDSAAYALARHYMTRLNADDFKAPQLAVLAKTIGLAPEAFSTRYGAQAAS